MTEGNHKNTHSHVGQYRDLNSGPPEYEYSVLFQLSNENLLSESSGRVKVDNS